MKKLIFLLVLVAYREVKYSSNVQGNNIGSTTKDKEHVAGKIYYNFRRPTLAPYKVRGFNPAWMDYCDPYHCNDYHKLACGLNRRNMRFKWFQSACHIIMNNMCSNYRGSLRYDVVDIKFCYQYVMYYRSGCPQDCTDDEEHPICGISLYDNHLVLFKNQCSLNATNCKSGILPEYEEIDLKWCLNYLYKSRN